MAKEIKPKKACNAGKVNLKAEQEAGKYTEGKGPASRGRKTK